MDRRRFVIGVALVLVLALAVRLVFIPLTAWDWDEPVYTAVSTAVNEVGFPSFRTENDGAVWYSFHPPFHFYLLANWYNLVGQSTIEAGRVLSALIATATVGVAMLFTYVSCGSRITTLMVGLLLAIDGWFAYTSMLVKFDTAAILLGVIGLCFFTLSVKRGGLLYALLAGMFAGFALVYKHVAGIFLAAILFHGLRRKDFDVHLITLVTALLLALLYVTGMAVVVGEPFTHASLVQVRRVLGYQESRGLNYGLSEVITALSTTYWAFGGTLGLVAFGLGVTVKRLWQPRQGKWQFWLLSCWTVASVFMLVVVKLRNPHYLGFLIVPATIAGAVQLVKWLESAGRTRKMAMGIIAGVLALNFVTIGIRYFQVESGNAFAELQHLLTQVPADAVVVAEEPICALIKQECHRMGVTQSEAQLAGADPDYIIVYTSITQRPPNAPALQRLISEGFEVARVNDWKAVITVIYVGDVSNEVP